MGKPLEYDHIQYSHQVPGGMISNLRHQLRLVGMEKKIPATLEERPVDSVVSVAFRWRQGAYEYERTARPVRED